MFKALLLKWLTHPARWWEFWYPMSGFQGAMLIWVIIFLCSIITGCDPINITSIGNQTP